MFVALSFRKEKLSSHRMEIHTIWYLSIVREYVEKLKFHLSLKRMTITLHDGLLFVISRRIILRMRNVTYKNWKKKS
jgi:hypothetical protein